MPWLGLESDDANQTIQTSVRTATTNVNNGAHSLNAANRPRFLPVFRCEMQTTTTGIDRASPGLLCDGNRWWWPPPFSRGAPIVLQGLDFWLLRTQGPSNAEPRRRSA